MKTLIAVLLLGFVATSATPQPIPVSAPQAPAFEETVGQMNLQGRWG